MQLLDTKDSIIECTEFVENKDLYIFFKENKEECEAYIEDVRHFGGLLVKNIKVNFNDYIIKEDDGNFYVCEPNIFQKFFEEEVMVL